MKSSWTALVLVLTMACTTKDIVSLGGDTSRPDRMGSSPDATLPPDDDGGVPDTGHVPTACGGITGVLCADGDACSFSGDCMAGSICNTSDDPYFDPASPRDVCTRLVCASDADCANGKVCSPERICTEVVCQTAFDCGPGTVCSAGVCAPQPLGAASCEVLTRDTFVRPGSEVRLEARVLDVSGRAVGGVGVVWRSSAPARVTIGSNVALGGGELGVAEITASIAAPPINCTGRVRIENVSPVSAPSVRVRVVDADSGAPLVGARVIMLADGAQQELIVDASGGVLFPPVGDVEWVTVLSAGREHVSVLSPGSRDLLIPVERAPTPARAGGFRGVVDVSSTARGDMYVGLVGAALPNDLSRFRLSTLLGDTVETVMNAPQLGFDNQVMDLPGNLLLRLGNERFTVDHSSGNLRCQGTNPAPTELGCYVARAPAGPGIGWTLSTKLRLQEVAAVAGRLSGALTEGFDVLQLLPDMIPLMRTAHHGVAANLSTVESPRVDAATGLTSALCSDPTTPAGDVRCRADYARYAPVRMEAVAPRSVHSAIAVPSMPRAPDGHWPQGVLVFAAAATGQRGLVPLGIGIGQDDARAPDGVVEGNDRPFGALSTALPPGLIALSSAVSHSGLEGSPLMLAAVAYDEGGIATDTGSRLSGLLDRPSRFVANMGFGGRSFLGYVTGVLDRAGATFRGRVPAGAMLLRIELVRGEHAWRIYAPPSTTTVTLPQVLPARADLLSGAVMPRVTLHALRGTATYADVFRLGAPVDLVQDATEAFSAQTCGVEATAGCRVE